MKAVVSWVIPSNRYDSSLIETIDSIQSDGYSYEVLVVLNGQAISSHKNRDLIGPDRKNVLVLFSEFRGIAQALNIGISMATGQYVARLDCGDLAVPGRIKRQIHLLERAPRVAVVSGAQINVDCNNCEISTVSHDLSPRQVEFLLWFRNPICHPSVLARRSVLLEVGGYGSAEYSEDFELWLRLIDAGMQIQVDSHLSVRYRLMSEGDARMHRKAYIGVLSSHLRSALTRRSLLGLSVFPIRALFYFVKYHSAKALRHWR